MEKVEYVAPDSCDWREPDRTAGERGEERCDAVYQRWTYMSTGIVKETYSDRYDSSYVLMTAAYNEEAFIEKTLSSVVSQTVLPRRWVIVSDGSTDKTDELVKRYATQYDFIRLLRVTRPVSRSFGAKVMALQTGSTLLNDLAFKFIGNIDADISVEPSYFEDLMHGFDRRPKSGLPRVWCMKRKLANSIAVGRTEGIQLVTRLNCSGGSVMRQSAVMRF